MKSVTERWEAVDKIWALYFNKMWLSEFDGQTEKYDIGEQNSLLLHFI